MRTDLIGPSARQVLTSGVGTKSRTCDDQKHTLQWKWQVSLWLKVKNETDLECGTWSMHTTSKEGGWYLPLHVIHNQYVSSVLQDLRCFFQEHFLLQENFKWKFLFLNVSNKSVSMSQFKSFFCNSFYSWIVQEFPGLFLHQGSVFFQMLLRRKKLVSNQSSPALTSSCHRMVTVKHGFEQVWVHRCWVVLADPDLLRAWLSHWTSTSQLSPFHMPTLSHCSLCPETVLD